MPGSHGWTRWYMSTWRTGRPDTDWRAIGSALRACASELDAVDAKLTPAPMFAQIATGQEPAEAG